MNRNQIKPGCSLKIQQELLKEKKEPGNQEAKDEREGKNPSRHQRVRTDRKEFAIVGINDLAVNLKKAVTPAAINDALQRASDQPALRGILRITEEELVSRDIIGDTHSSIVDAKSTMVMQKRIAKSRAWYDNEWGYSSRLVDFAKFVAFR